MTLNVNPANNRVTGSGISYDASGNLTSAMYGVPMSYDLANRMSGSAGGQVRYTARNERLIGANGVHMRGLGGEMIGVYRIDWENGNQYYTKPVRLPERERVYAAGRLLFEGGKFVATDRLGSVVYKFGTGMAMQNGGFETGVIDPWIPYGGGQATISTVARTGARSLRVTTPIVDRGVYQEVKNLVPGLTYQFQAWVRAESGTNTGALAACAPGGGGFVWTGVRTITSDWQLLTISFTATSHGMGYVFLAKWDTTGALLWDDVELVNGATATSGLKMRYYPYGQEVGTAIANDVAKFGTYTRDSGSGLDYAMNRYYQSTWGRFTSPDPYRASGGPADPGSWNRYAYVQGDPVNYGDPSGLLECPAGYFCASLDNRPKPKSDPISFMFYSNGPNPGKADPIDPNREDAGLGAGPGTLRAQFNAGMQARTASAFDGLSSPCREALRKAGIDPTAAAIAAASIIFHSTATDGGLLVSNVTGFRNDAPSLTLVAWLGTARATVLPSISWGVSNHVVVGNQFLTQVTYGTLQYSQEITLIHETLHVFTRANDIELAKQLGLGDFRNINDGHKIASLSISNWLAYGCASVEAKP